MKEMKVYTDDEVTTDALLDKTVAIIGYGAQGRAQARMLFESGIKVVVGVRENGPSWNQVNEDGIPVMSMSDAAKSGDIVHILLPDEVQQEIYTAHLRPHLVAGNIVSFSHGLNMVLGLIELPEGVGSIMVAPKAPGTEEYRAYRQGFGVPALFAVGKENAANNARLVALAMTKAMQFTRAGVIECNFQQEAYSDLFGEQAVLCGGVSALIQAGFEVLTERGYPAELAYFECLHETKLIVDLIVEGGMERMWEVVSNTAEFGGHTRGKRLITDATKAEMHKILDEIEEGKFANEMFDDYRHNKFGRLLEFRRQQAAHPIEVVGKRMRSLFKKGESK
jgi:ketol-acid reductoisomerase